MWFLIFALCCEFSSGERFQDPDAIYFPGPSSRRGERIVSNSTSDLARSLQIARQLNTLDSIDAYLAQVQGMPNQISTRMGGIMERSTALKAQPAFCMPETQTVPVVEDPDPSVVYIPECTRVKRCGGCCVHKLLSCQPTETRLINMEINTASVQNSSLRFRKKLILPIEEHIKCKCLCNIQEKHCSEKQEYFEEECRCQCKNNDEIEKCQTGDSRKVWNPELCICQCQEFKTCSNRFYFDPNTCSCTELTVPRWLTDDRTGYKFRPSNGNSRDRLPVIVPLDPSDPRRRPQPDPEF